MQRWTCAPKHGLDRDDTFRRPPFQASSRSTLVTRSKEPPYRVGLIGFGLAGQSFHAPFTGDPERQRLAASAYPSATVVRSTDDLWAKPREVDVIVIASPNRTHAPLAHGALSHGFHVVVDKPFATSAGDARALVGEARQRNRIITVFQNRRWDGDFLTVRRLLAEGALGQPLRFESRFERWRPVPRDNWRERGTPDEAGGLLFDLGSHLIDQALQLFGPVTSVYAELDRRRAGVQVDDDSFLALTHVSRVRSHLFMSAVAAHPGPRFRVLGSRAAYVKEGMDPQEAKLRAGQSPDRPGFGDDPRENWGQLGAENKFTPVPTEPGAYRRFYEGLVDALRGVAPPPVDPHDAVTTLAVIEAAQQSAAERRVIQVPSDALSL